MNRGNRGKENESDFPSKDVHKRNPLGRTRARAVHAAAAAVIHECLDDRVVRVICCAAGRRDGHRRPPRHRWLRNLPLPPLSLLPLPRACRPFPSSCPTAMKKVYRGDLQKGRFTPRRSFHPTQRHAHACEAVFNERAEVPRREKSCVCPA